MRRGLKFLSCYYLWVKKNDHPETIQVSDEELKKLKEDIQKTNLSSAQKKIVVSILESYYWLSSLYHAKKLSLNKIKRLFGFKTESIPKQKNSDEDKDKKDKPSKDKNDPKGGSKGKGSPDRPTKGHGRNGQKDHPGANRVFHELEGLNQGDLCPDCLMGKLYPVKPGVHIQFTGHAPIQASVHETQKLRCNACGKYFEAELPEEFRQKYHPSADVVIGIQKYGMGMPFYRNGKWQHDVGMPLPPSTQWERVEHLCNSVFGVFKVLIKLAANAGLFFADDTKNRILDRERQIKQNEEKRTGIFTTAVIAKLEDHVINLFFTRVAYAGENLEELLQKREVEEKAILMSDALSWNLPKEIAVIWANCLTHARRNFWDYRDKYGQMVIYILKLLARVYKNEKKTKDMNPDERLKFHQKHSQPILERLRRWGIKKIYTQKIEPNEELGDAFKYYFKHYPELTLFLRLPGVPIDNTIAERLLKTIILNRKNSYFYKTMMGAFVGDIMTSIITTCRSAKVNPHAYLLALHSNRDLVKSRPEDFLPWNYQANLPA